MGGEVEFRRAQPEDAADIRRLTREAYARWVPIIGREPKPMGVDYDAAVLQHRFDLLHLDGILVGLIEMVAEGETLLIEDVAIAPRLQGRGLGSRLMAHAEQIARASGRKRMRLYTNKRFVENITLYLRLGYSLDGEDEAGAGAVRVHMSKLLTPN